MQAGRAHILMGVGGKQGEKKGGKRDRDHAAGCLDSGSLFSPSPGFSTLRCSWIPCSSIFSIKQQGYILGLSVNQGDWDGLLGFLPFPSPEMGGEEKGMGERREGGEKKEKNI